MPDISQIHKFNAQRKNQYRYLLTVKYSTKNENMQSFYNKRL